VTYGDMVLRCGRYHHDLLANVREGPHEAPGNLIRRLCGVDENDMQVCTP
jgi:hypothetical protein